MLIPCVFHRSPFSILHVHMCLSWCFFSCSFFFFFFFCFFIILYFEFCKLWNWNKRQSPPALHTLVLLWFSKWERLSSAPNSCHCCYVWLLFIYSHWVHFRFSFVIPINCDLPFITHIVHNASYRFDVVVRWMFYWFGFSPQFSHISFSLSVFHFI